MEQARYAVLIASSEFPEEPKLQPLNAPTNDVDGIAEVFRDANRGGFTDVTVLKNRPNYEILRALQRTFNKATKEDLVVIYYSGHGKMNRAGELYLTATDTVITELESSAIPVSRLRSFIDVSPTQRVVMILDSCFSGAAGDVLLRGDVDSQLQIASSQGRGTYIMTASTGIQTAQEKEADQYSVFTKHFIAGIKTGDADSNRDGRITVDELYDYVDNRVRKESHQEPTRSGRDVRGHLVLAKSGRQPRQERANKIRDILIRLAGDKRIKDEVLTEALNIIKREPAELTELDQSRDKLLDDLNNRKIDALDLSIQWYSVGPSVEKEPPIKSKPISQEKDRLASGNENKKIHTGDDSKLQSLYKEKIEPEIKTYFDKAKFAYEENRKKINDDKNQINGEKQAKKSSLILKILRFLGVLYLWWMVTGLVAVFGLAIGEETFGYGSDVAIVFSIIGGVIGFLIGLFVFRFFWKRHVNKEKQIEAH